MNRPASKIGAVWFFGCCAIALAAISVWILQHNYLNDYALLRWSQIMVTLSAPDLRIEDLGLIYPVIPVYLLSLFFYVPGLNSPFAPYLFTCIIGAGLLGLWYYHLRRKGYSAGFGLLLATLSGLHPFYLWSITTGTEKALSIFMFYLLCLSFMRMTYRQDVQAFIMLGWVIAIYFLIDQRTLFLFIGLLPLLPLLTPSRMLRESSFSVYLIFSLPLAIFIFSWAYVNWVFRGDPWRFVTAPDSGFIGARLLVEQTPWLQQAGGYILEPSLIALLLGLMASPALLWITYRAYRSRLLFRSAVVFFLHPLLAFILATYVFFIDHPVSILFLFIPGIMAILILIPRLNYRRRMLLAVLLALGNLGGWVSMSYLPTEEMRNWRQAMLGHFLPPAYAEENRLGQWLAANRYHTLMDNAAAYPAIVARQDAHGLALPDGKDFKLAVKQEPPGIEQIVVMNPRIAQAAKDKITQRYPSLYDKGLSTHRLVYDQDYWRVYRRKDLL
jgi:hypothetical protein